jgi:HK97 family phage major capsid protein
MQLGAQAERTRIAEITALCAAHGSIPGVRELERTLIDEDCSVETARQYVLDRVRENSKLMRALEPMGDPLLPGTANRSFSIVRAIGSFLDPRMDAGLEREASQEIARRVGRQPEGIYVPLGELRQQRALDYAAGQPVVPPGYQHDSFIDALRARSFVMRLGTRVLPDLVGNVSIPRLATGQTAAWIAGDGVDGLPTTQPAFDSVTLSPKTIGALCVITRRMILQALPSAEQLVRDDFAKLIAAELDKAAIAGTGAANQPLGIVNIAGIGAGTYPLAGPDYPSVVAMEGGLMAANADAASIAYLTTPQLAAALKAKEKASGSGMFVWNAGREPGVGEVGGLPAYASSNVPLDKIILGNFSDLLMGMWGAIDVSVDPNYDFAKGSIAVRIFASVDFAVRHPQSFVVYSRGSV